MNASALSAHEEEEVRGEQNRNRGKGRTREAENLKGTDRLSAGGFQRLAARGQPSTSQPAWPRGKGHLQHFFPGKPSPASRSVNLGISFISIHYLYKGVVS
jgi:hypothetical protein